jgi:pullulanase/glycogen debranching enzyme
MHIAHPFFTASRQHNAEQKEEGGRGTHPPQLLNSGVEKLPQTPSFAKPQRQFIKLYNPLQQLSQGHPHQHHHLLLLLLLL